MSKKLWIFLGAMALLHLTGQRALAQTITITFSSDAGGVSLGGSNTSAASLAFGNVQAFGGSIPAGATKSLNGTTSWTLSTPLDVLVTISGSTSASYTLNAQLRSTDVLHTWTFGGAVLSSASPETITLSGTYDASTPYVLALTIPFSTSAGMLSNTIDCIVTAN